MADEVDGGQEAAERIKIIFNAAENADVSYGIYWQILNNRETGRPTCRPAQRTNFGLISVKSGYWMYLEFSRQSIHRRCCRPIIRTQWKGVSSNAVLF